MKLGVCIPVYDDWQSALLLLRHIDRVSRGFADQTRVLFVDDGSSEPHPSAIDYLPSGLTSVRVLRLRRNLGHQRAIAIGLTHLFVHGDDDAVVVMDADGEDNPDTIAQLLDCWQHQPASCVVFAARSERRESVGFRLGYVFYKVLYRLLVGRSMRFGNFSVVGRAALRSLVTVSELWNHYAAAVLLARLPVATAALPRASRLAGRSKMNFVNLILHGLSAISVNGDVVAVRMLVVTVSLIALLFVAILAVIGIRFGTSLAIPGWASSTVGALLAMLLNLTLISTLMVLFALRTRAQDTFVPLRDFQLYVDDEIVLYEAPR